MPTQVYSDSGLAGLRVLIVDDNATNRWILSEQIKRWGMIPREVTGGREALAFEESGEHVDLVLLDVEMPDMDGLEATRRIRANPQTGHIPIVALTALAMSGDRELCFEAGVNDYLSKPLRLDQLQQVINRLLDKPGSE